MIHKEKEFTKKQVATIEKVGKLLQILQMEGLEVYGRKDQLCFYHKINMDVARNEKSLFGDQKKPIPHITLSITDSGDSDPFCYPKGIVIKKKHDKD